MRPIRFLCLSLLLALTAFAARAAERKVAIPAEGVSLPGYVSAPSGAGPFPAVLLVHSCLGLPSNRAEIGRRLEKAGFVALFIDEFAPRGLTETCTRDFPEGARDAAAAGAWLAAQSEVDPARIAIVGFSQGGAIALEEAVASRGFKAAAALYPPCANVAGQRLAIPTLVEVGADDNVTPAADCAALARVNPKTLRLVVYPEAGHVFDDPQFAGGVDRLGMHLIYDPKHAGPAYAELMRFLAAEIGN
jgi:dienelactone hydrolase